MATLLARRVLAHGAANFNQNSNRHQAMSGSIRCGKSLMANANGWELIADFFIENCFAATRIIESRDPLFSCGFWTPFFSVSLCLLW
jgi:hypothetical protein